MQQGAAPAQSREVRLILAELSKVGCSAPVGQIEPCYRLERPPAQNCLSCRARLALDAAPTPEYVSGWLACQRVAIDDVAAAYHELMAPSRLSSEFFARRIRALAPPSAPPVQQIEARVQELLSVIHGEHADPPGCNCVYCEEYRSGRSERLDAMTICDAPSDEDRMLLLKALLPGSVAFEDGWVYIGHTSAHEAPLDSDGFPTISDSLRAALTEATHG